ncbi:MAG: argininosuccinate synthase [Candidatus ainarchaeum sp.]|nr:argininosuccinate synthase [Candidatus ainarchaeum sp.]
MENGNGEKIVLAYSGGLDTSVLAKWLSEKNFEVIAALVDVGQKEETNLEKKALASGAKKFYSLDAKEEFVSKGVFQCLKAEAKYEGKYLLGTSIARPFIIKKLLEIAKKEKTNILAHGATGKGNDQCRFELTAKALEPDVKIIAPWREKEFRDTIPGRKEAIGYAKKHWIPIVATVKKPWSTDANLAHISHEAGLLEEPWNESTGEMYEIVTPPENAPDNATDLAIEFENGFPIGVNGKQIQPVELLEFLNEIGGKNGVGLLDMVENRFVGMKSRGVYESPGMAILYAAHRDLEGITMDRDLMHLRDSLSPKYAELVYYGFWCSRELHALNAFVDASQKGVTGTVKLQLYKGNISIKGRKSPCSLYDENIATMEKGGSFNQDDSTGFLKIKSLPLKVESRVNKTLGIDFF